MKHTNKGRLVPQVDYRNFRLSKINDQEYRHTKLLLFWPIYILSYFFVEAVNPVERCFLIHTAVDDMIPFCEWFIIPYLLWSPIMLGVQLYLMVYDVPAFKKYSKFLIVSFSIATVIFLVFPTYQNLRPEQLSRDNLLTRLVGLIYAVDTSTNVCPSGHVIGSFAYWAAALHSDVFRTPGKMTVITILAILTSVATVFLKQHTIIDVVAAIPVCAVAYWICYRKKGSK